MFSHREACTTDMTPLVACRTCVQAYRPCWALSKSFDGSLVSVDALECSSQSASVTKGDMVFRYILTVRADGRKRDFPPPAMPVTEGAAHL